MKIHRPEIFCAALMRHCLALEVRFGVHGHVKSITGTGIAMLQLSCLPKLA